MQLRTFTSLTCQSTVEEIIPPPTPAGECPVVVHAHLQQAYRELQVASGGCQYAVLTGVRTPPFWATAASRLLSRRLGPSASSAAPQQNVKEDGAAGGARGASRRENLSKHNTSCSAVP